MNSVLGIDVAKATVDVVLVHSVDPPVHATFDNTAQGFKQLKRWLDKRDVQTLHPCLEATGNFSDDLATFLYEAGYTVSVVNPARISAYAKSQLRRSLPNSAAPRPHPPGRRLTQPGKNCKA